MILTVKQEEGRKVAVERYLKGYKYTCISGYAGSGKSTLVKFIVASLSNIDPEKDVCYCAFTGKATQVLLQKGNKNVSTLHKLIYESHLKSDGTWYRKLIPDIPYKILIIDEVSMVPGSMWRQLLTYNCYILALGDPFQLPSINAEDTNDILAYPQVFLDEIMRQAQESEIIRISMDIRAGKPLKLFDGNEVKVYSRNDLTESMLLWADQILVGTNATRISINNTMRKMLNREGGPQDGDKIICLRNYWDIAADNDDPLVNGTIGYLKNSYSTFATFPKTLTTQKFNVLHGDFFTDWGDCFRDLSMDKKMIMTGEKCCDFKTAYRISQSKKHCYKMPLEFTYGYSITTHRAQGSQWSKVLIIEENFPFDKIEHSRWLYTSLTRAVDRAVIIKKD